jgi:hypothetical protein
MTDQPATPDTQGGELKEYLQLRNGTDPIEAFNLFIKRNCPDLYAHFIDSDDNEAEFVRRIMRRYTAKKVRAEWQALNDEVLTSHYIYLVDDPIAEIKAFKDKRLGALQQTEGKLDV